ncbi:putative cytochrome b245, heavy chain, ferric reductase transmembrane component-like protein [Plasmopara halstedii]
MADYNAHKTPEVDVGNQRRLLVQKATPSTTIHVLRSIIVLSIACFIFGNIATWAPLYELNLVNTITDWWNGYPNAPVDSGHSHGHGHILDTSVGRNITESGHTEMVRPTFLFIFCIAPFIISVLLIEYLRHINTARRLTSTLIWRFAMLMRRKPKFPYLGVSRFTVGEWIFGVIYVLGGNALCFYYQWDRRIDKATKAGTLNTDKYWNIIGISSAYLCIYNMSFLMLPVTRNSPWMEFFNISYANGVKFHRWIGFMTVITGVVHMLGYWIYWIRLGTWQENQLPCTSCNFTLDEPGGGYYVWFNIFGFISVLALVLIVPTSFPIIRRKAYEWFYITHWVLFVIAVLFAILHWAQILWWILPSGCVWFVSRAASSWNAMTPVSVKEFTIIGEGQEELVKLVVKRAAPGTSPSSPSYDYKPGNFLYLNIPQISKFEWHALTIASSPKSSPTDVTVLIKPLGDWSKSLVQHAKDSLHDNVMPLMYMDGFYGASLELYEDYSTVCLVGGGIGVTPVLAILDDLAAKLSVNGANWTQRVIFIFAFRELSVFQTVAPVLARLRELDPNRQLFRTHLFATGTYSEDVLAKKLETSPSKEVMDVVTVKLESRAAHPFYEPLRSSNTLRFIMYAMLYVIAIGVLFSVRWGNGVIQGDNRWELWPLDRAFQLAIFCMTIVVVYAFVWYEYIMFHRSHVSKEETPPTADTPQSNGVAFGGDVHTMGDLIHHFDVAVGERPDMHSLLQQTLLIHKKDDSSENLLPAVGVIVSGPPALKMVTNEAVYNLGGGNFDVHEEEFEV